MHGTILAWMNKELLTEFRLKKQAYRRCKQGQVTQEEYEVAVWSAKTGQESQS